jgi:integrase
MSKKRMVFPMVVPKGSVHVTIYKVRNKAYLVRTKDETAQEKERFSFMLSYFADGKRRQKMFADFEAAHTEAKSAADKLAAGQLDAVAMSNKESAAYAHSVEALKPTGMPLELAAREYAEAWKVLGGKASIIEAAKEFARRHLHTLPNKMLPEAVKEMLEAKEREHASKAYMKVLKFYLNQLADAFHCQLRSVTTSQLGDLLRNMDCSARSKNNARQTIGAFFKYCKERGWLPKDHDGISMVPKFKEKAGDIEIFTPQEMANFLSYSRPEMVPFLAIGAFAGLRSAEIERLDWSEVHLAERFIEVKAAKAKTASRRIVPMTENLAKWLAPHAQMEGRVVPFDNVNKQLGWLVEDTNAGLKAAAKKEKKGPEKVKSAVWRKNALRHSFISYRVADAQNVNQTALEAGNSPAVIFKHDRELVRPADAKKWFAIEPGAAMNVAAMPKAKGKAATASAASSQPSPTFVSPPVVICGYK